MPCGCKSKKNVSWPEHKCICPYYSILVRRKPLPAEIIHKIAPIGSKNWPQIKISYPLSMFLRSDYPIHIHYPCFWKAIIQSISIIHVFEKWLSDPYPLSMFLKTDYPIHIHYPCFWKVIIQSISIIHAFENRLSNPYPISSG